jgi:hypothetical protein
MIEQRYDLINYFIERYGYRSYLEIGCQDDKCFSRMECGHKVGIDPNRGGTLKITSDNFFKINREKFDLIFVDGCHWNEVAYRDVINSLNFLTRDGLIVMHDCNPLTANSCLRGGPLSIHGDCWKALVMLKMRKDLEIVTSEIDCGCAVIVNRESTDREFDFNLKLNELNFEMLNRNRRKMLRLRDVNETLQIVHRAFRGFIKV